MAVLDRDQAGLARAALELASLGVDVRTWQVDVSDAGRVDEVYDDIVDHFGTLDVGFNNAGTIAPAQIVHEMSQLSDL